MERPTRMAQDLRNHPSSEVIEPDAEEMRRRPGFRPGMVRPRIREDSKNGGEDLRMHTLSLAAFAAILMALTVQSQTRTTAS
jgi:hypothetical protein